MARVAGCTRSRERRALWRCSALAIAAASGFRRTISRQRHGNGIDARQRRDGLLGRYAQGFELARPRRLHSDGEIDLALVVHDLGNEALGDDVVPEIGAFDALKRLEHALFGERFGHYAGYLCLLRGNTNCLVAPMFTDPAGFASAGLELFVEAAQEGEIASIGCIACPAVALMRVGGEVVKHLHAGIEFDVFAVAVRTPV